MTTLLSLITRLHASLNSGVKAYCAHDISGRSTAGVSEIHIRIRCRADSKFGCVVAISRIGAYSRYERRSSSLAFCRQVVLYEDALRFWHL